MKTNEQYEDDFSRTQNYYICKKCNESFIYKPDEDIWWDEHGFGYSTKLVKCKHCGCINVIKNNEDYGFSNMNIDTRLYDYTR